MRAPAPSLRPMNGAPTDSREVHHLVDLLGEHLAERAAEDREVLREQEHLAAVDRAPPGDDAVGERSVVARCRSRARGGGRACRARRTNPGRASSSMRSRAVSLPRSCWRWTAASAAGVERLFLQLRELVETVLEGNRGRRRCAAVGCGHGGQAIRACVRRLRTRCAETRRSRSGCGSTCTASCRCADPRAPCRGQTSRTP